MEVVGVVCVINDWFSLSVDVLLSESGLGLSCSPVCCLDVEGWSYKFKLELSGQLSSDVVIIFVKGTGGM